MRALLVSFFVGALLVPPGCAGAPSAAPAAYARELELARAELQAGDSEAAERRANRLLAETKTSREPHGLERFRAAELLAELHMERSLAEESARPETSPVPSASRRGEGELVAVVYHASQALSERDRALAAYARAPEGPSPAQASERLALFLAGAYTRLGFPEEASAALAPWPELQQASRALARSAELEFPRACLPDVCSALFELLRSRGDEQEAYRFAVLAIEAQQRFGRALPAAERERLEHWIESGASVLFVCPRSQTPWIAGLTRSPISGIPHLEYVAVERPR